MASTPPSIFSPARRAAARQRLRTMQRLHTNAARFVIDDMIEDVIDRLRFVRHEPERALIIGDWTGTLAEHLERHGTEVVRADPAPGDGEQGLDEERPYPFSGFDFIASLATLDTVNDLPGALIHIRQALQPGGLAIVSFVGAGSLPVLRSALLAADGERPAARLHPAVDVRAGAQLLQRAGWSDPVVDGHALRVRYSAMTRLVEDLRAQGLGNVLSSAPPPLTRASTAKAEQAFAAHEDADGRITETFEIVTLSGRRK